MSGTTVGMAGLLGSMNVVEGNCWQAAIAGRALICRIDSTQVGSRAAPKPEGCKTRDNGGKKV